MKKLLFLFALTAGIFMLAPQTMFAQNSKLTVHVEDNYGPLIGANVYDKACPTVGAATDKDGDACFSCPANATIVISFIGYETQEISRNNQGYIDVQMVETSYVIPPIIVTPDD